jgi:hypothetical protein
MGLREAPDSRSHKLHSYKLAAAQGCRELLGKIRDADEEDRILSAEDTFGRTPLENAFKLAEVPVVSLLLARYQERGIREVLERVRDERWPGGVCPPRSLPQAKAQFKAKWGEASLHLRGPSTLETCAHFVRGTPAILRSVSALPQVADSRAGAAASAGLPQKGQGSKGGCQSYPAGRPANSAASQ